MTAASLLLAAALAAAEQGATPTGDDPSAPLSERTAATRASVPPMPAARLSVPPAPPSDDRERTHWYGGPTLISDAAAAAAIYAGAKTKDGEPLLFLGITTFGIGGMINHGLHRQSGRAVASLALRFSAVIVTYLGLAASTGSCNVSDGGGTCDQGLLFAGVAAMFGTAIVDDLVLSREPAAPPPAPRARAWSPTVAVARGRAFAAIGAAF